MGWEPRVGRGGRSGCGDQPEVTRVLHRTSLHLLNNLQSQSDNNFIFHLSGRGVFGTIAAPSAALVATPPPR